MRPSAALLLILLVLPCTAMAGPGVGGVMRGLWLRQADSRTLPAATLANGSVRLQLETDLGADIRFEAAAQHNRLYLSVPALLPAASRTNRRLRLEKNHDDTGVNRATTEVDRLLLRWQGRANRLILGRQAIGFGRVLLFSPLDVIAPFAPDAVDTDYRPGVDALLVSHYLDRGGEIGLYAVWGDEPRHNSRLVSFDGRLGPVDLLVLAGSLRDRPMAGIGLAGDLGGLGWHLETTGYRGTRIGQPAGDLDKHIVMGALELMYRFGGDLTLMAEWLHNGAGRRDPAEAPRVRTSAFFSEGMTFFTGRDELLLAPSWQVHPLVEASLLAFVNLDDHSWQLRPLAAVSLADNVELQLFASFFGGRSPHPGPAPGLVVARSEFGGRGVSVGSFLSWTFSMPP